MAYRPGRGLDPITMGDNAKAILGCVREAWDPVSLSLSSCERKSKRILEVRGMVLK